MPMVIQFPCLRAARAYRSSRRIVGERIVPQQKYKKQRATRQQMMKTNIALIFDNIINRCPLGTIHVRRRKINPIYRNPIKNEYPSGLKARAKNMLPHARTTTQQPCRPERRRTLPVSWRTYGCATSFYSGGTSRYSRQRSDFGPKTYSFGCDFQKKKTRSGTCTRRNL